MRETWWRVCACRSQMRRLFRQLCVLDYILDVLLLLLALIIVTPPRRSFVLALQSEIPACFTLTLSFIAFLSSKPAGETT